MSDTAMSDTEAQRILIAGGGPSGLVTAIELTRRGVPCRVIDIARSATDKSKAIGVQARTLEIFKNMGIADQFVAAGKKMTGVNVLHDGKQLVHLSTAGIKSPFNYLLMIPQSETERILTSYLESLGMQVEREVKLTAFTQDADGVTATLEHADGSTEEMRTPWLVGCDGAHSIVRHTLNLPFQGEEYAEGFMLADVYIDWPWRDDELYVVIHEGYLFAAFPLPGGHFRLIADVPPEQAPVDQTPTLEQWQAIIDERSPVKATLSNPLWMANYRIHRRLVSQLGKDRAFLVGDAAHIHSPVGAQGMNTGIQDAANLAWKLALVMQGVADKSLLETYNAERYPVEHSVLTATDLPLKAIGVHNPIAQAVRDRLLPFLSSLDFVQEKILAAVSETAVHYPHSPIVENHSLDGGPRAGDRVLDCEVPGEDGAATTLFRRLQGPEHKLLLFGCADGKETDRDEDLAAAEDLVQKRLGAQVKVLKFSGPGTEAVQELYGIDDGGVYLVRPDGYIGFRSPSDEAADHLPKYLERVYGGK